MIAVVTSIALAKLLHQYNDVNRFPKELAKKYKPLKEWLSEYDGSLKPTFPNTDNETLLTHFQLTTQKKPGTKELEALLRITGIDGAYEKPGDDLPS